MAERDPEFAQDVLEILYQGLKDRAALAAALGREQSPVASPVATPAAAPAAPAAQNPGAWVTGTEIIIRVGPSGGPTVSGASQPYDLTHGTARCCPDEKSGLTAGTLRCPDREFWAYEGGSFAQPIEDLITALAESLPLSRPELVDEALRRLLAAEIQKFAAERGVGGPNDHRQAPPEEYPTGQQNE